MAQSPHDAHSDVNQNLAKMDRIQLEFVGPMGVHLNYERCTYYQSGMDVSTRLSFVSLLKSKSDALQVSRASIEALEVESKTKLKSLRTDGGWGIYLSCLERLCEKERLHPSGDCPIQSTIKRSYRTPQPNISGENEMSAALVQTA